MKASGGLVRLRGVLTGAVGIIAIATLSSRLIGFLRWLMQSALVGSGATAGAYASANQIPNIIFEIVVGGALAGITVPLLSAPLAKGRAQYANRVASALLSWVTLILAVVAAVVFLAAPWIAQALPVPADAIVADQQALVTRFLQIFAWQIPLYGVSIVLTGVLQSHKKFFWPAIAPALSSLTVVASFVGYALLNPARDQAPPQTAVEVLGWGTTLGVAALSLPLFIPARRAGFRFRPTLRLGADERRRAVGLGASGLGALVAQQFAVVVSLWLMRSYGASGTVAVFQYLQAVYWLPYAVAVYPVATAAFPLLSEQGESGCTDQFKVTSARAMQKVLIAALLGSALLVIMAPVAQAFFELLTPVPGMASALTIMAPALIGFSLLFYGQRALYALSHPRLAWLVAAAGWVTVAAAQAALVAVSVRAEGDGVATLRAIAGGHSVGMTVAAIGVLVSIHKVTDGYGARDMLVVVARSLVPLGLTTALGTLATTHISALGEGLGHVLAVIAAGFVGLTILAGVVSTLGKKSVLAGLLQSMEDKDS